MNSVEFFNNLGEIGEVIVYDEYRDIWNDVSSTNQNIKADRAGLSPDDRLSVFLELAKRPSYLVKAAKLLMAKNIVEIGTAEGLQFYSFAQYLKDNFNNGRVWSCDIFDSRAEEYKSKYDNSEFYLGTSEYLSSKLPLDAKIDLIYVDAGHGKNEVLTDVENMKKFQHDQTLWVFDDYDSRFGCYEDINELCKRNDNFKIYKVGNTASNSPNHQVMIYGKL